ncbi:MAG: HdeD family acid-resistance protein [Sphingomonas sp.]|uniref:HdeD family acid-resistance protein n=1 Tax=Sphingomonas sp. TaxID=28214 RepID=UPI001B104211|nr:HdeD family acid-resistance protein [Sphingomonas sp.]MBO9623567.1 HdeD family acid-resistance protein [Sphingomonas sp.]
MKASRLGGLEYNPRYRPGFLVLGVILMLCGIFAVMAPLLSTLAVTLAVGVSAAVAGIAQVVQAFRASAWKGFFLNLLIGLAFLATAVIFLLWPPKGALAITITVSWLLLIAGIGEVALAFRVRPERGWGWLAISGLVAIAAGLWLMYRIPVTGFFVPGVALGVALLFEGAAFAAMAIAGGGPVVDEARFDGAPGVPPDREPPVL